MVLDLPTALTMLSLSAPVTVAIVKFVPRKTAQRMDGVSHREFDAFRVEMRNSLTEIRKDLRDIRRSLLGP